jgi:hypothetical protein
MSTAKRATLQLAKPPKRVPYSLIKQAVRLFRSEIAPRSVRRANARKWLASMLMLGDKHVYRGGTVSWGHPQPQQRKGAK